MTYEEAAYLIDYHKDKDITIFSTLSGYTHYGKPVNIVRRQDLGEWQLILHIHNTNYQLYFDIPDIKYIEFIDYDLGL